MYEYKMVAVPLRISVKYGCDKGDVIAGYAENIANEMTEEGWEFYRTDSYVQVQTPGCLGALMGQKDIYDNYNVMCFRRLKQE